MIPFFKRSLQLITLKTDFTNPVWASRKFSVTLLFILSTAVVLLNQFSFGIDNWIFLGLNLLTPASILFLPRVLGIAYGTLLLCQGVLTYLLFVSMIHFGLPYWARETMGAALLLFCFACCVKALLAYIRTPKSKIASIASK